MTTALIPFAAHNAAPPCIVTTTVNGAAGTNSAS